MSDRIWTADRLAELARTSGSVVDTSDEARAAASADFGHLVNGCARGVARPRTLDETQAILDFARLRGLPVTLRGGGLSQSGQSVPRDGLSVDLRDLAELGDPDRERRLVRCGPGSTWRRLVTKLLAQGLIPKVLPLNLDLTVGGTLSAGGFGSTSHRFGPAVSNLAEVTVITREGRRVECARDRERALFDEVLGGSGQAGAIVSVELELRPVPSNVRTFFLAYETLDGLLADQEAVSTRADHVEGFCAATLHGLRKGPLGRRQPLALWSYGLHVSVEHEAGESPAAADVLAGLGPHRLLHIEDDTAADFAARYDVRFEAMKALGAWEQPHPWLESVLPLDAARDVIPRALAMLPAFLGDGHRIFIVADTDRPRALAFPAKGPFVSFAILPMGVPKAFLEPAMKALAAVDALARGAGGTRYRSGWLFERPAKSELAATSGHPLSSDFDSCAFESPHFVAGAPHSRALPSSESNLDDGQPPAPGRAGDRLQ